MNIQIVKNSVYATLLALALNACSVDNKGAAAPNVQFKTIAGKQFDTNSLKGKVTLVNFWATSCTTCVQEMPLLSEKFNTYKDKGYRTVAVAMEYDEPAFIQNFTNDRKLPFDVVHDKDGSIASAFNQVKLTPTSYLIDQKGMIVKRYVGAPKADELKATIESLLSQS